MVLAMVGKAGISGGWAALQVFSAELFPTVVRNIGVGTCSFSARIGAIVAPQIVYLVSLLLSLGICHDMTEKIVHRGPVLQN